MLGASIAPLGTTTVLTNQIFGTINAGVQTADAELDAAIAAHRTTPAQLPLDQVNHVYRAPITWILRVCSGIDIIQKVCILA
jgi:hypothetical protein